MKRGTKCQTPGFPASAKKAGLKCRKHLDAEVFSPRNAATTGEPQLHVSPRDSGHSEQRHSRDTCAPRDVSRVCTHKPGCCSSGNTLRLGEHELTLCASSNAMFSTSYLSLVPPQKAAASMCPEGCPELALPEKLQNQRREERSLAAGGLGRGMGHRGSSECPAGPG